MTYFRSTKAYFKNVLPCTQCFKNYQPLLHLLIFDLSLGHVPTGLKCHPDQEHVVYPLGCTVLIQGINTNEQNFLQGHGNNVSCVTISKSGVYIASGQVTFMGFKVTKLKATRRELTQRGLRSETAPRGASSVPRLTRVCPPRLPPDFPRAGSHSIRPSEEPGVFTPDAAAGDRPRSGTKVAV